MQPRPHASPIVHVRATGGRHVRIVVRDVEQGRALLRALALDASRVSAHYWAMARPLGEPRAFGHAGALLGLTLATGLVVGPSVPPVFAVALVALIVLFAGLVLPTRVVVGGDGVLLRWLGTVRFVPWSRVTGDRAVRWRRHARARHPRPATKSGSPCGCPRSTSATTRSATRWSSAWSPRGERTRPLARPEAVSRLLGRDGGRTREWVRAMRALVRPAQGFRAASVPAERLWRVVEDPRADRETRTGAAIALAPTLHDADQARLRAVAEGCAEPRLRIALATAAVEARAPDDVVAEALDALEAEGEAPTRAPAGASPERSLYVLSFSSVARVTVRSSPTALRDARGDLLDSPAPLRPASEKSISAGPGSIGRSR